MSVVGARRRRAACSVGVADHPVAYWPLSADDDGDGGDGGEAVDLVKGPPLATMKPVAFRAPGVVGSAITFDGTGRLTAAISSIEYTPKKLRDKDWLQ